MNALHDRVINYPRTPRSEISDRKKVVFVDVRFDSCVRKPALNRWPMRDMFFIADVVQQAPSGSLMSLLHVYGSINEYIRTIIIQSLYIRRTKC